MKTLKYSSYILQIVFLLVLQTSCTSKNESTRQTPNSNKNRKPNIVIIYADDQGSLDAGCYGVNDIETPTIDNLAKEGVKFTQAYAHTVCCPSRAALLTGRAPQRSGVNNWTSCSPKDFEGRALNLKEITIAEHLKKFGYTTGLFGKWHLGATDNQTPLDQGFDEFFGFRGGFIDYYSHNFLHAKWQKPQFHDLYDGRKEIFRTGEYFPDMQVSKASEFIEKNKEKPFFLYLPFNLPHYPEQADSTFIKKYKNLQWPRNSYAAMISTFDAKMGQILDKLKTAGLEENTLVIYMSDNGHSTEDYYNWDVSYGGNGGGGFTGKWRGAKGSFFEGGLRVPAIMKYPNHIPKNIVRNQAIVNLDILPTICDVIDIPLPETILDGQSILPLIMNNNVKSHHKVMHWMWQEMWAVRKGNWKLIYKGHDTTGKYANHPEKEFSMPDYYLANIEDEKPEEINYATKYPQIVEDLKALHVVWAEDIFKGSGYPDPNLVKETKDLNTKGSTKL
jgi:arylsulfatase A-like enzyme